jgi:O-antigen/teichoic acid export membrane protein
MEKSNITLSLKSILVNFSHLAFGEFASKAFGFLTTVYLARTLGVDEFGMFGFISAVSAYVVLFANFGIEQYSAQRLSSDTERDTGKMISTVILTRFLLTFLFIIPYLIFGYAFTGSKNDFYLFAVQSLLIFSFAFNIQFFFIAVKKIREIAFIKIIISVVILSATVLFVKENGDLVTALYINGIVSFIVFFGSIFYSYTSIGSRITAPTGNDIITLIKNAAPLGLSALMIQLYHSADIIILGFTDPGVQLGYYTGAYRIINVLTILPGLFYVIFLPDLTKITENFFQSMVTKKYIIIQVMSGIAITGIFFISPSTIIHLLLGEEYLPAELSFRILLVNVFLVFVNVALAHLFIAWGRHKIYLLIVTSGAGINVVCNVLLIPQYGIVGAAIATVCAEIAVLCTALWYHYKVHRLFKVVQVNR